MSNSTNTVFAWIEIAKRRLLDSKAFWLVALAGVVPQTRHGCGRALAAGDGQIEMEVRMQVLRLDWSYCGQNRQEAKITHCLLAGWATVCRYTVVDNSVFIPFTS
ncbi:MAG: hypothetical protein ACNYPG_02980 [Candidatus Porifericomitaceae bacterium WSBS_2022_MAG_OTU9]